MLRTSSFLTIALGIAAIGSATVPAAANPLTVFGGGSRLAQVSAAAPVLTKPQASQEASHVLGKGVDLPKIPAAPGQASVSPGKVMIPMPKAGTGLTSVGNAEDSCATNPKLCGPVTPPHPPICKSFPKCEPLPPPPHNNNDDHHHPVVIFVPQAPVQVPVAVPVAVSSAMPARVATGSSASSAPTAQPVVTPACMTAADIPALAAGIDQLLPTTQLSDGDMSKVTELRQTIQVLATDGKVAAARDVEEIAMNILGYQKVWLRCGLGTFEWEKQTATAQATQAK